MNGLVRFLVGGRYANRRGEYEVLSISGDKLVIRYDDGVTQEVSISTQARIYQNMALEAAAISPYPDTQAARTQAFYESVGFLAMRSTMLEAIVPPHSLDGFVRDYMNVKGVAPKSGQSGFYVHDPSADKWGCELRITFAAAENETGGLDFGPGVDIVFNPANENSWRINNNGLWWRLLKLGFEMGKAAQNVGIVRSLIHFQLRGYFDAGVHRAG
jgi:hypothetical protein